MNFKWSQLFQILTYFLKNGWKRCAKASTLTSNNVQYDQIRSLELIIETLGKWENYIYFQNFSIFRNMVQVSESTHPTCNFIYVIWSHKIISTPIFSEIHWKTVMLDMWECLRFLLHTTVWNFGKLKDNGLLGFVLLKLLVAWYHIRRILTWKAKT